MARAVWLFDVTQQQLIQGEQDRNQIAFATHYDILPHVSARLALRRTVAKDVT